MILSCQGPAKDKVLRMRNKSTGYINHLQKSIVDNVTNVYGILFMASFSLLAGAVGLYHGHRLRTNSAKSVEKLHEIEKLQPSMLSPVVFAILAAISAWALFPYFLSHALRSNFYIGQRQRQRQRQRQSL